MDNIRFTDVTAQFDPADIERNKIICGISIIIPILFFLPLVAAQDSKVGRFYANQALLLLLTSVVSGVLGLIPFIGWLAEGLVGICVTVCCIMGLVYALTNRAKRIPLIGHYDIIK